MRDKMASVCVVCLLLASTSLLAMSYHRTAAVSYAECWCGDRNDAFEDYCGSGGDARRDTSHIS
jgi:hypothetical protein